MKNYYTMLDSKGEELGRWVGLADENQHRLGEVIDGTAAAVVVDCILVVDSELSVRQERNSLLAASDWTQVADAPVDQSTWAAYRQSLRDITQQDGFPSNVAWPAQPV